VVVERLRILDALRSESVVGSGSAKAFELI
jgi:hypothetical protein